MGLGQAAILATALAAILAGLGAFLASQGGSQNKSADDLGAALVGLLTAPEPDWWTEGHGTWIEDIERVRQLFPRDGFPPLPAGTLQNKITPEDHPLKTRNKERLVEVERAMGRLQGSAFQGAQIISSDQKKLGSQSVGARINPNALTTSYTLGKDVSVGFTVAEPALGSRFRARVYHRPYKDRKGHVVGNAYVILDEAKLTAASGGGGMWIFLTPVLVAAACGLFLLAASKASAGLKSLARDLDTIGRGRLDLRVATSGSGEVGYAQRTADRMAKNLQLIQTTGSGDLDEALEKELDLANQIHQGMLPTDPPRIPGYELEALFKVGRDIGGDYHDYIELDTNRVAIVLADCSESLRGVPAAMVMAMTRAYVRASVDPAASPADWLKAVNRRLARDLKSGMAVTAMILVIDSTTHEALVVSAGHRPLILWRQNKTATINPNGIALGLDVGPVFEKTMEEKRFSFQKGDRVVLYTDGVISARNDGGEMYGEHNLLESVRRQGAMNSAAFVNFVAGGVDKFLDGAEQLDDVTICTLKRMK
jgi:hypothetical protein